ncbi:amino acid permease-domain-containing protein [Blastocladiella britannica]|nr:amino acid permease-domain-containing protein [Blastocladiella britannica]
MIVASPSSNMTLAAVETRVTIDPVQHRRILDWMHTSQPDDLDATAGHLHHHDDHDLNHDAPAGTPNGDDEEVVHLLNDLEPGLQQRNSGSASRRLGYIRGVTIPTCEFMWSVLIFMRFPSILGHLGLVATLLLVLGCALIVAVTATSIAAIATNGLPRHGVVPVLTRTLGSGIGGAISLVFALGVAIFSTVEVTGSVEGLVGAGGEIFPDSPLGRLDGRLVSLVSLLFLVLSALAGHKFVMRLASGFMIALVTAFASLFLGLVFASTSSHQFPGRRLGWTMSTLHENLGPAPDASFASALSLLFPCFLGILMGVNNASSLRNPYMAIPRGALTAIGLSATLYTVLFFSLACTIPRAVLSHDFFVIPKIGWPFPHLVVAGVFMVGNGSALHCILLASSVLSSLFSTGVLSRGGRMWIPPLEWRSGRRGWLHDPNATAAGEPRVAIMCVSLLALPFIFVGDLEQLAKVVALFFLQAYCLSNAACALLSALQPPIWRPIFQGYSTWTSAGGALLCAGLLFVIGPIAAACLLLATMTITAAIQVLSREERLVWGQAIHGLLYSMTLRHLLAVEQERMLEVEHAFRLDLHRTETEDLSNMNMYDPQQPAASYSSGAWGESSAASRRLHVSTLLSSSVVGSLMHRAGHGRGQTLATVNALWRPQIVAFLGMPSGRIQHPRLLSLVAQLSPKGSGLCVLSHIVVPEVPTLRSDNRGADVENTGAGDVPHHHKSRADAADKEAGTDLDLEAMRPQEDVRLSIGGAAARRRRILLHHAMEHEGIAGFVKVVVAPSVRAGQSVLLQSLGLGELTSNTVLAAWPEGRSGSWADNVSAVRELGHLWRLARECDHNMIVAKGISTFPDSQPGEEDLGSRYIDIWWIVNEGPLILLMAYILQQHAVWNSAPLRLFAVARAGVEDLDRLERTLRDYLLLLRIPTRHIEIVPVTLDPQDLIRGGMDVSAGMNLAGTLQAEMMQRDITVTSQTSATQQQQDRHHSLKSPAPLLIERVVAAAAAVGLGTSFLGGNASASAMSATLHTQLADGSEVPEAVDERQLPGVPVAGLDFVEVATAVPIIRLNQPSAATSTSSRNDEDQQSRRLSAAASAAPPVRRATMGAIRAAIEARSGDSETVALVLVNLPAPSAALQQSSSAADEGGANVFGLQAGLRAGVHLELFAFLTEGVQRSMLVHSSARTRARIAGAEQAFMLSS